MLARSAAASSTRTCLGRATLGSSATGTSSTPGPPLAAEPLWYGRDMVEKILAAEPKHDVGSHSFSHVIFGDAGCTREVAEAEVRKCVELAGAMGLKLESFVFPRNQLGHLDVLREQGFRITRGAAPFWFA